MRCNRAGQMGMRREFTALLICGVWEMLMGERRTTTLELSGEFGDEDRDRSALLLALWSWDLRRFERATARCRTAVYRCCRVSSIHFRVLRELDLTSILRDEIVGLS